MLFAKICHQDMQELFHCHVLGNCTRGMTAHSNRDDPEELFRLEPKGKLLNMTYFVSVPDGNGTIATINLLASRGMKVLGADDHELFRVVDGRAPLDKFMTDALQGACKAYNIALGSTCAGDFKTHERPASSSSKASGFIRRSIGKLLGPGSDWCLDLGDNTERIADHRPLLASMVLLLEQTVRSDQSS